MICGHRTALLIPFALRLSLAANLMRNTFLLSSYTSQYPTHYSPQERGKRQSNGGETYPFLLRCPRPSLEQWEKKMNFSIEWSQHKDFSTEKSTTPILMITQGKSPRGPRMDNLGELIVVNSPATASDGQPDSDACSSIVDARQWPTAEHSRAALMFMCGDRRRRFEYEEAKRWFALRIEYPPELRESQRREVNYAGGRNVDVGRWVCELTLRFSNWSVIHSESSRVLESGWSPLHDGLPTVGPKTHERRHKTSRRRINSNESTRKHMAADAQRASKPAAGDLHDLFTFSKDSTEQVIFQRLSKLEEIVYTRAGDTIEYNRETDNSHRSASSAIRRQEEQMGEETLWHHGLENHHYEFHSSTPATHTITPLRLMLFLTLIELCPTLLLSL